ncbi:MAG TPA: polysaccharide deacetylase family protein, partial [Acidimicrobiia bacterium]|nr:polysaccharide deacetylase family protein [Acidimicrobiia bacterium]
MKHRRRRAGRRRRVLALAAVFVAGLVAAGAVVATSSAGTPIRVRRTVPTVTTVPFTVPTTVPPPPPPMPPVFYNGPRDHPTVALTFDSNLTDAMIQELNSGRVASFANVAVIDELDRLQVPATIFLAGKWIERYPDLTRRLAADPLFELGSHSYAHEAFHQPCYGLGTLPAAQMAADVAHSEALLREFTSRPTPYFR